MSNQCVARAALKPRDRHRVRDGVRHRVRALGPRGVGFAVTGRERAQFDADTELVGERAAYWLAREHQGWSALDEEIYYRAIDRTRANRHEPAWSPYDHDRRMVA